MFPGSTSPQRGRRGGGRWRWPWDTGAQRRPRFPPSNLSCATAWAQRASRFPPLGGDQEQIPGTKGTKWDVLLQKSPYESVASTSRRR